MILSDLIILKVVQDNVLNEKIICNKDKIDSLWKQGVSENKSLYNGELLSFIGLQEHENSITITGTYVEYKDYWVQRQYPDLNFGIIPIAVSGIILFEVQGEKYTVMARRREDVTQYANYWELVPSGSIDKLFLGIDRIIDYKAQLKREFTEETCLNEDVIQDIRTLALIYDEDSPVYDICCKIVVNCNIGEIQRSMEGSLEYYQPKIIKIDELNKFVIENKHLIIPTSLVIIDFMK